MTKSHSVRFFLIFATSLVPALAGAQILIVPGPSHPISEVCADYRPLYPSELRQDTPHNDDTQTSQNIFDLGLGDQAVNLIVSQGSRQWYTGIAQEGPYILVIYDDVVAPGVVDAAGNVCWSASLVLVQTTQERLYGLPRTCYSSRPCARLLGAPALPRIGAADAETPVEEVASVQPTPSEPAANLEPTPSEPAANLEPTPSEPAANLEPTPSELTADPESTPSEPMANLEP